MRRRISIRGCVRPLVRRSVRLSVPRYFQTRTRRILCRVSGLVTLPKLNYSAATYDNMIEWKTAQMTEPPLLKDLSGDEIKLNLEKPFSLDVPGNTQFVERRIKVITQKGCRAASPTLRDGITGATITSQKAMPRCKAKKDYSALN